MNAPPKRKPAKADPVTPTGWTADGYDQWLEAELAEGTRQLDAGKTVPLDRIRKEFGTE